MEMVCGLPESLYHYLSGTTKSLFSEENPLEAELTDVGKGTDLAATDAAVLIWLRERLRTANRPEDRLINGILSRKLYKRLWVLSRDMDEKRFDKILRAWDQLNRTKRCRGALEYERAIAGQFSKQRVSITEMSGETAQGFINDRTAGEIPWLLIDIPGSRPGAEIGLHCVLESQGRKLRKDDRAVGDLQQSMVWERYARNLRDVAGRIRIFCDPLLVDSVDASIDLPTGFDELLEVLERLNT
jgi:hypothetical protein